MKILQRVEQFEHRATPAGKLCDEDYVDIACLRQCKDFLAFGPLIFRPKAVSFQTPAIL